MHMYMYVYVYICICPRADPPRGRWRPVHVRACMCMCVRARMCTRVYLAAQQKLPHELDREDESAEEANVVEGPNDAVAEIRNLDHRVRRVEVGVLKASRD